MGIFASKVVAVLNSLDEAAAMAAMAEHGAQHTRNGSPSTMKEEKSSDIDESVIALLNEPSVKPKADQPKIKLIEEEESDDEDSEDTSDTKLDSDKYYIPPDRRDWDPINAIPSKSFQRLLLQHLDPTNQLSPSACTIQFESSGSFHRVIIAELCGKSYAIKVPAHGTRARWLPGDAACLRSEVGTMKYIRKHTEVPVPEVFAFDDSLENELGAPYILMEAVGGRPAYEGWYSYFEDEDGELQLDTQDQDFSPLEVNEWRERFLESLAKVMAELGKLEFDKIGMLRFDKGEDTPDVGPSYAWSREPDVKEEELGIEKALLKTPVFSSSREYWEYGINQKLPSSITHPQTRGKRAMFETIVNFPPLDSSKKPGDDKETFVLWHNDLDLQNIYTDDHGNVTSIIDWDGTLIVPRCVGSAAVPVFLSTDWQPQNFLSDSDKPLMMVSTGLYRLSYAKAMMKYSPDGQFTQKSALFLALKDALYGQGDAHDALKKVFRQIPQLRNVKVKDWEVRFGEGWAMGETYFESLLGGVLDPDRTKDFY